MSDDMDSGRKARIKFKTLAKVSARLLAPTVNNISRMRTIAELHPASRLARRGREALPDYDEAKAVSARASASHRSRSVPRQRRSNPRGRSSRQGSSGPRSSSVPRRRPERSGGRSHRRRRPNPHTTTTSSGAHESAPSSAASSVVAHHRSTPRSTASTTRSAGPRAWGGTVSSTTRSARSDHSHPTTRPLSETHDRFASSLRGRGGGPSTAPAPPPFRSASAAETRTQAASRDREAARQSLLLSGVGKGAPPHSPFAASLDKFMAKLRQSEDPELKPPPPPARRSASAEPLPSHKRGGGGGERGGSRRRGGPSSSRTRRRQHHPSSSASSSSRGGESSGVQVRSRAGVSSRGRRPDRDSRPVQRPSDMHDARPTDAHMPRSSSVPKYASRPQRSPPPPPSATAGGGPTTSSYGSSSSSLSAAPTSRADMLRRVKAQVNVAMQELSSTRMALVEKADTVQEMTSKINDLLSLVAGLLQVLMAQGTPPPSSALSGFPKAAQSALLESVLSPQTSINYPNEASIKRYIHDRLNHIETLLPGKADTGPPVPAPIATSQTTSSSDILSRISKLVADANTQAAVPPSPTSYTSSPARPPMPPSAVLPISSSSALSAAALQTTSGTGATDDTLTATPPSTASHDLLPPFPTALYGKDGPPPPPPSTTSSFTNGGHAPPPPPPPASRPPATFTTSGRPSTPPMDDSVAAAIAASRQRLHASLGMTQ